MIKKELQYMVSNEKLVNEALRAALGEINATSSIEKFLEKLGTSMHCDRIYIFEGKKNCSVNNTFEWCAEGVTAEIDALQNVPYEAVSWWYDTFNTYDHLVIGNIEDIKETEPLTYEYLKPQNIHSLITAPLKKGDEIFGFFGVDNPPEYAIHNATYIIEIVAHFMVSLLEKKKLMDKLERMSYEDHLTGVYNRNALNDFLEENLQVNNLGMVYCDVLGLKRVNDTLGHQAGDNLLIRASECLKSTFRKNDIYRIGGDEFLIISVGIEENTFKKRIVELKEKMGNYDVKISLGTVWKPLSTDVEQVIYEADALMYEDKRAYYASNDCARGTKRWETK